MAPLLDGIVYGLQLALLGVGLTLVFGLGGVLNLAHGQLVTVAAVTSALATGAGAALPVALAAGLAAPVAVALGLHVTLLRPVYRREGEARVLLGLLLTLGVAFALDGLLVATFPNAALSLRVPGQAVSVAGVALRAGSLVASALALAALAALVVLLRATRLGSAIRAVIQDERGAQLCGIAPGRVRALVHVLAAVLAGLVALTQGVVASVAPTAGFEFTILGLIVAVVGGLGSVAGALVAGLLLGVVHAVGAALFGSHLTFALLLAAVVVTLLVRPAGLLGHRPAGIGLPASTAGTGGSTGMRA